MCLTSTDLAMSPRRIQGRKPKIVASIECLPHTNPCVKSFMHIHI